MSPSDMEKSQGKFPSKHLPEMLPFPETGTGGHKNELPDEAWSGICHDVY